MSKKDKGTKYRLASDEIEAAREAAGIACMTLAFAASLAKGLGVDEVAHLAVKHQERYHVLHENLGRVTQATVRLKDEPPTEYGVGLPADAPQGLLDLLRHLGIDPKDALVETVDLSGPDD